MSRTIGPGPWCGTNGGYGNHRCRCDRCTEAHRAYQNAYMRSHPEQREKNALRTRTLYQAAKSKAQTDD